MKLIISIIVAFISLMTNSSDNTEPNVITDPLQESISRGKEVYSDFCTSCHLPNGQGVKNVYPPLASSDYLMNKRKESIAAIKYGLEGEIVVNGKIYNNYMGALGLTDTEVADVMNYITNSWGNKNDKMVTKDEVSKIKK